MKRRYEVGASLILRNLKVGESIDVHYEGEKEAHRIRAIASYYKSMGEGDWAVKRIEIGLYRITRFQ